MLFQQTLFPTFVSLRRPPVLDAKVTFWRDADGEAFATVPRKGRIERYRVRGTAFRNIVRGIYGDAFPSKLGTPGALSDTAWREARPQLESDCLPWACALARSESASRQWRDHMD